MIKTALPNAMDKIIVRHAKLVACLELRYVSLSKLFPALIISLP